MTIAAGTNLGRYEIRSKIGAGGMGEVYLAQDTKLDRKVALKILPGDVASNHDRMERFVREAKSAAALNQAMLLAKAGKARAAEETIQHAIEIGKSFGHFHHTAYNIASAYALMNKPEPALKSLQAAADDGFPCYPWFENDANLNNLRKDKHFVAFMAKLKQQWEHYQATL